MKRATFISLFVATQVCLVVLQINKHSNRIQLLYEKQKNESIRARLRVKQQELIQQLYALKDRAAVKEYARTHLHMKPVQLSQIKKIKDAYDRQNL